MNASHPRTYRSAAAIVAALLLTSLGAMAHARARGLLAFSGAHEVLYVMNDDGTDRREITHWAGGLFSPTWSPDGRKLAFARGRFVAGGGWRDSDICTIDLDGTNLSVLGEGRGPAWSPGGTKIAYRSHRRRHWHLNIFVMDADGTNVKQITDARDLDTSPDWSPGGHRLVFTRDRDGDGENGRIMVVNADATGLKALTHGPLSDWSPSWSPDGSKIAYESGDHDDDDWGIYTLELKPPGRRRRIADGGGPTWSPDGREIAFLRNRDIYIVSSTGGRPRRITFNGESKMHLAWFSPDAARPIPPDGRAATTWADIKHR